ncbi:putative leader peptide [Streptomyces albireticuli]|uniref:putative leader peptide n=1 Tax=Streptomyces albireticuli TaxID=1940 RepID=UPI003558558C
MRRGCATHLRSGPPGTVDHTYGPLRPHHDPLQAPGRYRAAPGRATGRLPAGTPVPRAVVYDDEVTMLVKRRHVDLLRVTSMSCRRFG